MKNKAIEYPHPVLSVLTNDFIGCSFFIECVSFEDNDSSIDMEISYELTSPGLSKMISQKKASMLLRLMCYRTSFRKVVQMNSLGTTVIHVPKNEVTDSLDLQAVIIANTSQNDYFLEEFNRNYFGNFQFSLRKGDVLAIEPGINVKLDSEKEKDAAGIVLIRKASNNSSEMSIHFACEEDDDPNNTDYIYISLPENDYTQYAKLRTRRHLKNGVDRLLQCSIILPAITEGISLLRREELIEDDESTSHYSNTLWASSVLSALSKVGVTDLSSCLESDFELANKILGNVVSDSISNIMRKSTEWSTIQQEEDI